MKLPPEQHGPSAWVGSELVKDRSWIWELSETEIDQLLNQRFSPDLRTRAERLRQELIRGRGFELIRGLPVDQVTVEEAGRIFTEFGQLLGMPRSQNGAGDLLGHVRNVGADVTDPNVRIYQTDKRQTFHTDSTDVVGLLCLETAASGGESLLVSAATIYNRMLQQAPDLAALLFQPVATDRRGEVPPGQKPYFSIPVLNWYDDALTVIYQRQYIQSAERFDDVPPLTEAMTNALDLFDEIANDPSVHIRMTLNRGDMQFVHNHSLLHDRTGFVDRAGSPRHLLRLWLSVPGDRKLPPAFAQRYGSIEVGDRGGIVVG